jgi:hypothetical protein
MIMKHFNKYFISTLALLFIFSAAFSQKNKNKDKDDATVTIRINGQEQDIEAYFEQWGEEFGRKMERMFDNPNIHININEDDFNMDIDNICINISDLAESIAKTVTDAVTNMTIELNDLNPEDVRSHDFDFNNDEHLEDLIDEIERKYNSEVKNIDRLKIKIREDYVKIELDATLENGKKIEKLKIYTH